MSQNIATFRKSGDMLEASMIADTIYAFILGQAPSATHASDAKRSSYTHPAAYAEAPAYVQLTPEELDRLRVENEAQFKKDAEAHRKALSKEGDGSSQPQQR
jgi:hypothetical protein